MSEMQRLEAIEKRKKEEIVQIYNFLCVSNSIMSY